MRHELVRVALTCGHSRAVVPGIALLIASGHITSQRCQACGIEATISDREPS